MFIFSTDFEIRARENFVNLDHSGTREHLFGRRISMGFRKRFTLSPSHEVVEVTPPGLD